MMPRSLRARWVLPITQPPIADGWVAVTGGQITAGGRGSAPGPTQDLGEVALLPGLVNAHTHLELSALAGRVPPAGSMVPWIRRLMAERGRPSTPETGSPLRPVQEAIAEVRRTGTALVGDVSNTLAPVRLLA